MVVLICMSLMPNGAKHLFMCSLARATCVLKFVGTQPHLFAYLLSGLLSYHSGRIERLFTLWHLEEKSADA